MRPNPVTASPAVHKAANSPQDMPAAAAASPLSLPSWTGYPRVYMVYFMENHQQEWMKYG